MVAWCAEALGVHSALRSHCWALHAGNACEQVECNALLAHHCGAVAHALCLHCVNAWRGLLIAWGGVYEAGSVLLNLGYLGFIPQAAGHCLAGATSLVGMGLGAHGLIRYLPSGGFNSAARFCVTALLIIGVGRVQIAYANLKQAQASCTLSSAG